MIPRSKGARQRFLLAVVAGLTLGGVVLVSRGHSPDALDSLVFELLTLALVLIACTPLTWAAVAVHELGHVIAGKLVGYKFHLIQIGPLGIRSVGNRLQPYRAGRMTLTNGLAVMLPASADWNSAAFRWFVLGGPLASLVWFACTYFAARHAISAVWPQGLVWLLVAAAAVAAICAATSLIPHRFRTHHNDGALIVLSAFRPRFADRLAAGYLLAAQIGAGMRARDWDSSLLQKALSLEDGSAADARFEFLAYYHDLDRGEYPSALEHVERARELALRDKNAFGNLIGSSVTFEAAYARAWIGKDPSSARELLAEVDSYPSLLEAERLRALAAIALAEGQVELSIQLVVQGEAALAEHNPERRPAVEAESEWLGQIREAAQNSVAEMV